MGSRDGLQAGSASVILGQCPPWAHSVTWEIAFKAIGRLVYRGRTVAFFFFLFLKSFFGNGSEPGLQQTSGRWDVDTNFRERGAEADMDADHSRGTPKPPLPLSPCSSLTPGKLTSHL